jgi:acetoin utilization deacetylase AcuC-like enzyme
MGFCLLNNVAVAAAHARSRGCSKVAIVDFDVHHGNGTQEIFASDPRVLYVSTHQWPFYPGSGAYDDCGSGAGAGTTINIPLEAGATAADYALVYRDVVRPVLHEYAPELLIVSAGFDAHEFDPLAGMRMTTAGFGDVMRELCAAATDTCGARVVLVTEGGYHLPALAASLDAALAVLAGRSVAASEAAEAPAESAALDPRRARAAIHKVRAVQRTYWRGL